MRVSLYKKQEEFPEKLKKQKIGRNVFYIERKLEFLDTFQNQKMR